MLDFARTRAWTSGDVRRTYDARDTILYALGLGVGSDDPLAPAALRLVVERDLVALPTMAAVLASPGFWMRERAELGIDWMKLVHGEQSLVVHGTLPPAGTVLGRSRVTRIVDKGAGKGAVVHVEKTLAEDGAAAGARLLATVESVYFLRGDGGFAAAQDVDSDPPADAPRPLPDAEPDLAAEIGTRPDQALMYRLSGDLNPLHVDPAMAARVGFPRPILHGLATWGIAGRAAAKALAAEPDRLTALRARFSAPVLPGETLRLEGWRDGERGLAFRVRAIERDVVVLTNGSAVFSPA